MLTFLAINISFVMFRADNISTAIVIYKGMLGLNGYSLGYMANLQTWMLELRITLLTILSAFLIVLLAPNTISISSKLTEYFARKDLLIYVSILFFTGIIYALLQVNFYESPFLYFRF